MTTFTDTVHFATTDPKGVLPGDYTFVEKESPAPSDIAFAMSTANVVMEGVRRVVAARIS